MNTHVFSNSIIPTLVKCKIKSIQTESKYLHNKYKEIIINPSVVPKIMVYH